MKIAFLIGSGSSCNAGIPLSYKITRQILSGEYVSFLGNNFIIDKTLSNQLKDKGGFEERFKIIEFIKFLLTRINDESEKYYSQKKKSDEDRGGVNYEDIYYVVKQILDSENEDYPNPTIQPFIERIMPDLMSFRNSLRIEAGIKELFDLSRNYFYDLVAQKLYKPSFTVDELSHLQFIEDVSRDYKLDLFSLNHDIVLEKFLKSKDLIFTNGFHKKKVYSDFNTPYEITYWEAHFEGEEHKIRLFKLHGSIDWYRFEGGYGIPSDTYNEAYSKHIGRYDPMILMGSLNKIVNYYYQVFEELHYRFSQTLREIEVLFVYGYGFGDKGINVRLTEWLDSESSKKRKIVIFDVADESEYSKKANVIVGKHRWDRWKQNGQLFYENIKGLNVTLQAIKSFL